VVEADWGDLLDASSSRPLWSGVFKAIDSPSLLVWFWWQVWDTARMDAGFTCNSRDAADGSEKAINQMVDGIIADLVWPTLRGNYDWTMERKAAVRESRVSRTGREYERVQGKVVLRVPYGEWLNGPMNAVKRFADDMGWDGKDAGWRA
jgi:hypothetical protein